MLLVVYSHVMGMCLGDSSMGFNDVFFLFRLPCFFFISGWLFYKPYELKDVVPVVRRKFSVQIVPTLIFLLLLAPPPLFFTKLGATKGGYWFTFALFEFFAIYLASALLCRGKRREVIMLLIALALSMAAHAYDVCYNGIEERLGVLKSVLGALSFMTWRYYLFFFLGTWARKHFDVFLRLTDRRDFLVLCLAGFMLAALLPHTESGAQEYLRFAFGGVAGIALAFTFFRKFARWFGSEHAWGRALQFTGRRTLDIYLLHYFLLPRFLLPFGARVGSYGNPLMEMAVGLVLAIAVTVLCLLASRMLRFSPFLARLLFGERGKERK